MLDNAIAYGPSLMVAGTQTGLTLIEWSVTMREVCVGERSPGSVVRTAVYQMACHLKWPPHVLSVSDQFRVPGPTGLPLTPPVVTRHGGTYTHTHTKAQPDPGSQRPTHGNYYLILNSKGNHFISQKANYQPSKYLENEMNSDLLLYLGFLHGNSNSGFKQSWERKINVR